MSKLTTRQSSASAVPPLPALLERRVSLFTLAVAIATLLTTWIGLLAWGLVGLARLLFSLL